MSFLNDLEIETSVTETENGGRALSSTGDGLLNLFAVLGALRSRPHDIIEKFDDAYNENADLATKMVFYGRDVRGGLGERTVGRLMLHRLAEINPDVVNRKIQNIVQYGRWDDLFVLFGTECENAMLNIVSTQLSADLIAMREDKPVSLLAKWMPSINTSSRNTVALATRLARALKMTHATYRKTLSKLRRYIDVVEVKMSANEWEKIDYERVPSKAMSNYDSAFANHDYIRFMNYLNDVKEGKAKINAATLYPYDIIEKLHCRDNYDTCDLQWKALPNYVEGDNNFLVMADVSGSMMGRPMATSVGLAIYFAERNHGEYAGKFMTFTNDPHLVTIKGNTLADKYYSVTQEVGYNTNLEKAFDVVLSTAVRTNCPQIELPKALVVISDMEIDTWGGGSLTFTEEMRKRFADVGYEMPKLVYWNVDSRHDTFLASKNDPNTILVSGQSASTFKNLIKGIECSAFEIMEQMLNDERYADVIVPSQLDTEVLY